MQQSGLANASEGRFAAVDVLSYASTAAPLVHVIGDASATTQPKAGHIANQEAKVCADALTRVFAGGAPDPAPVTNSACFSTITMTQASWLTAVFQYEPVRADAAGAGSQRRLEWVERGQLQGHGNLVPGPDGRQLRLSIPWMKRAAMPPVRPPSCAGSSPA